ncbi:MAG: site-specific DNA-methyltransferase [Phycisphaerales bacterium]|nr:site-specific DNA-methyltransferase [Phycisphaerales bacterium]
MTIDLRHGDWLTLARDLPAGSIDMLYADLPFNTGKAQKSPPAGGKVKGRTTEAKYTDAWPTPSRYIEWLRERLVATIPALTGTGSVLLHVDYRVSHHVRLLLDDVLGPDCFVNHLIWAYGLGGSSPRSFARKHDDILFYAREPGRHWFKPPMVSATSRRLAGRLKKSTDVLDIPSINNMARERTGYPTQKPLALLEVLVGACCPPGGTVLDPCCGSGTTLEAAERHGRHAIGFDASIDALEIARRRLGCAGADRSGGVAR